MALTYFYAEWLGTLITLIGLALLINRRAMLLTLREIIDSRGVLFVVGIVTFLVGLLVVLTDNIWSGSLIQIVVTLVGWLLILRSVLIFFLPHGTMRRIFNVVRFEQAYYAVAIIALVVGLFMAYSGFAAYGF